MTNERPQTLKMTIHTGMLEALGINMYTSVGKSLVEFIANSFDADAKRVDITFPDEEIHEEREKLRPFSSNATKVLPEHISISIADDGHGMSASEIENKFLAINRNRRDTPEGKKPKSEGGRRYVMGRKGLGKLAGFGIAEKIIIESKRADDEKVTKIEMDYRKIKEKEDMKEVEFEAEYDNTWDRNKSGTTITLCNLRVSSFKSRLDKIQEMVSRNFYITGGDFNIFWNGTELPPLNIEYDYVYPSKDEFGLAAIECEDGEKYNFEYKVMFRKTGDHVNATLRGARIYCHNRLAAGPSLFNLPTGMHNFHATSYMECVVNADFLDQQDIDLIATSRTDLQSDHFLVTAFIEKITALMKEGIAKHGAYREGVIEDELQNDETSQNILKIVSTLSRKNQEPAKKVLKVLAKDMNIKDDSFKEVAMHLVGAINAAPVLIKLLERNTPISDIKEITRQLSELAKIEASDLLKLFRARRSALVKLHDLYERALYTRERYEKDFHQLLKKEPWIINPEYNSYISSERSIKSVMATLYSKIGVNPDLTASNPEGSNRRPDLVFLVATYPVPTSVAVVELKSPNKPLEYKDLMQLKQYMITIEKYLQENFPEGSVKVTGHLIGSEPSKTDDLLLQDIKDAGPKTLWEIITIPDLISRTEKVHEFSIEALEEIENEDS